MAGRPKRNRDLKALEKLGVEPIEELVASGLGLVKVAEKLGVSKGDLFKFMDGTEEKRVLFSRARARASHLLADAALEIADDLDRGDHAATQRDRLRVETRKWLAGKWNQDAYGDKQAPLVNVDLGSLHLDALRAAGSVPEPEKKDASGDLLKKAVVEKSKNQ